jgi:hypothetical protein
MAFPFALRMAFDTLNICFVARKKPTNLKGYSMGTSGPLGYRIILDMKVVGHLGDAAHLTHQVAIIEARGRGADGSPEKNRAL